MENHHEGIISKEDFMKVQTILDNRGTPKRQINGKRQEALSRKYAFSCITKCGCCGGTYTRRHWHGGKSYDKVVWQCANNTKGGKKECPNAKGIEETALERAFLTAYNIVCSDLKSSSKRVYYEIKKEFKLDYDAKEITNIQENQTNLDKIKAVLESDDGLSGFDKSVLESICEKIIIGNETDPYVIKFIFKTKDKIYLDAKEYIMKIKAELKNCKEYKF